MWPALIAAGASLAGSALSMKNANKQNAFQKDLAQNSVQWRVNDMRAAGINPILAANPGQGATTIGSSSPDVSGLNSAGSQMAAAVQAKTARTQMQSNVELQGAQTANYNASNELIKQQAMTEASRRGLMSAQVGDLNSSAALKRMDGEIRRVEADFVNTEAGREVVKGNLMTKHGVAGATINTGLIAGKKIDNVINTRNTNSATRVRKDNSFTGNGNYTYGAQYRR